VLLLLSYFLNFFCAIIIIIIIIAILGFKFRQGLHLLPLEPRPSRSTPYGRTVGLLGGINSGFGFNVYAGSFMCKVILHNFSIVTKSILYKKKKQTSLPRCLKKLKAQKAVKPVILPTFKTLRYDSHTIKIPLHSAHLSGF
jgi:hypothetical protein